MLTKNIIWYGFEVGVAIFGRIRRFWWLWTRIWTRRDWVWTPDAILLFKRSTRIYQLSSWTHSNVAGTHLSTKAITSSHTLASATGGSTWQCLVMPDTTWLQCLVVPDSTWQHNLVCQIIPTSIWQCLVTAESTWQQCLVAPDSAWLQCIWQCLAIEIFVP